MSLEAPQLGVLVMDDGREFGAAAGTLVPQLRPSSVRVAIEGAPERPGLRTVRRVPPEKFTLRTAVEAAAAEELFWIIAPRAVQDPLSAFVDVARGAAGALDETHPGFAVAFADPTREVHKIALVADLQDPVTTGMSVWAAVGAAIWFRARLDVLVLGADGPVAPADWRSVLPLFTLRGASEQLVIGALERAEEYGLRLGWKPLGSPANKPNAILRVVSDGNYDFVIDDLPAINVGPKVGRRRRVQAALSQAGSNATAYRLLRDADCGVVVVLDAVRMGLIPADMMKAAGVAALTVGLVGGVVAAGGSAAAETTATMVATDTGAASTAVADAQAQAFDPTGMTAEDLAAIEQQRDQAIAVRDQAAAELAAEQATQAQLNQELAAVNASLEQLQPQVDQANAAADAASQEAAWMELMTSGPMTLIPGGPTHQQAADARVEADAAQAEADSLEASLETLEAQEDQLSQGLAEVEAQVAVTQQELATAATNADALSAQADQLAFHLDPVVIPTAPGWTISTTYGESGGNWSSGHHTGLDFAQPAGADVYAAKGGVVVQAGWGGAYGNTVVIQHSDGTQTLYAHLSRIDVAVGQSVTAGQTIGAVGSSGNTTGPHLHFEVIDPSGAQIDPAPWLGL